VPDILVNISQVVIGCSLGAQFRREFLTKAVSHDARVASSIVLVLAVMANRRDHCAYAFRCRSRRWRSPSAPAGWPR